MSSNRGSDGACAVGRSAVSASTQRGGYITADEVDLANARLYGIIDLGYVERGDAARVVEQMIEGGVDLIQLRGKNKSIGELAGSRSRVT